MAHFVALLTDQLNFTRRGEPVESRDRFAIKYVFILLLFYFLSFRFAYRTLQKH